ncbi:MAG TPA: Ig-like domain-containing protein [Longimicrobiales bacterium]
MPKCYLSSLVLLVSACGGDSAGPLGGNPVPASISFESVPAGLVPGEEATLRAIVKTSGGAVISAPPALTWTSSSNAIATVTGAGVVKGVAPGAVTITATSGSASGTVNLTVDQGAFIGSEGGVVSGFEGHARLQIPAGALTRGTAIRVTAISGTPIDVTHLRSSGARIEFDGVFAVPAQLTLSYDPAVAPTGLPESRLAVRALTNNVWTSLGGTVDANGDRATANISGPGSFGVGMRPSETPCTAPEHRQFDFRIGNFTWAGPSNLTGEADIVAEVSGCALLETLRFGTAIVSAVMLFEPASAKWHYTSVDGSVLTRLSGGVEDGRMVLYNSVRNRRVVWEQSAPNAHRQRGEVSSNGVDWTPQGEGVYSLKTAAADVITPAGGKFTFASGALTLDVPAGAVTQNVKIESVTVTETGGPVDPANVLGAVYNVTSNPAVSFLVPVTLTIKYLQGRGPLGLPEHAFGLARVNTSGSLWEPIANSTVDTLGNTVAAAVQTLGRFTARRVPPTAPCTAPEHRQLDFWLGDWDVGTIHSTISEEPGGCAVYELYRAPQTGRSISFYDPGTQKWYQTYISAAQPTLPLRMSGGIENGKMVMVVRLPSGDLAQRWTWEQVDAHTVTQKAEGTSNNGTTWQQVFLGTYRRRP